MKRSIVLFKGQSRYDVLRYFVDYLSEGFVELGYETKIVDFLQDDFSNDLVKVFENNDVLSVVSFNAIGCDLRIDQKSLYDYLNIPFVAFMVDHPMYHISRLNSNISKMIITCVDKSHIDYIQGIMNLDKTLAFIPHAGIPKRLSLDTKPAEDRSIDILFCGSFENPNEIRRKWKEGVGGWLSEFIDYFVEYILQFEYISYTEAFFDILKNNDIFLNKDNINKLFSLLPLIDKFIRAYRRAGIIDELADFNLHIYGNGWSDFIKNPLHLKVYDSVDYNRVIELMKDSKIVLNINPFFPYGSHERVFSAMQCGAVVASDKNGYLLREFKDKENIIFYEWSNIDNFKSVLSNLLLNTDKLNLIATSGKKIVEEKHLWVNRAQKILDLIYLTTVTKLLN